MKEDLRMNLIALRSIQASLELNYDDFRTDEPPGEELESAIIEIEKWAESKGED